MQSLSKLFLLLLLIFVSINISRAHSTEYDLVIEGGRVIDAETGLDEVRNIGINNDRIEEISTNRLNGLRVVDASGLIVSAGFIDLHVHGMTNVEQEFQAHDGVTTALELESGLPFLRSWYQSREGNAMINYGASVSWGSARFLAMQKYLSITSDATAFDSVLEELFFESVYESLSNEEILLMQKHVTAELEAGGIGIGVPIGYFPGATPEEDFRLYEHAGDKQTPIFSHVRKGGTIAIQQAIANAMLTKAPLHIVHMNSMALGDISLGIEMVHKAQEQGYEITTEVYPYTAASTSLESALFNDGWKSELGVSYQDLQWVATGERLNSDTFYSFREQGGTVIIHLMKPEWIAAGIKSTGTVIASDGMPYAKLAHPRTAGTFSRVLGKYVRQDKVLTLNEALAKMTLLPAKVLENFVPGMKNKGRIQVGADADITIFNAETIIDNATFEKGLAFSTGVQFVIVGGNLVLENGSTVTDVYPGKPIFGKFRR